MSAHQKKHPFYFKTQYGLGFSTQDDEIVVDFFCGGGGAGTGLEMGLGRAVNVAKNHSPQAISMHTVRSYAVDVVRSLGSSIRNPLVVASTIRNLTMTARDQPSNHASGIKQVIDLLKEAT